VWVKNTAPNPGTRHFKGIVTPDLNAQIAAWQPDGILIFGWAYSAHMQAIRYFYRKVPLYFRGDSTLLSEPSGIRRLLKTIFLRWVYHHIRHAFYVGRNNKAYFLKYGLKEKQLSFSPHAIDNDRFARSREAEARALRSSLNIGEDAILVLYAGKFEPVKDLDVLLSAFGQLRHTGVHLVLAGNGIEEQALRERARQSSVSNRIHFLPFQNQSAMPVLYQACDLFCLPSKSESWGLSINEAMACGKAVAASDKVGCAADLIREMQNGTIFKQGDAGDLAKTLNELTADKKILFKFGQCSRKIISEWTFEAIAAGIEQQFLNDAERVPGTRKTN
jgi:glycosyltransferase involved in cell wall biosynthesis